MPARSSSTARSLRLSPAFTTPARSPAPAPSAPSWSAPAAPSRPATRPARSPSAIPRSSPAAPSNSKSANTSGDAGTAYDLLSISGKLLITATSDNPFLLDVASLNGLVAGAAANFNPTADYSFTFLTTTGGIEGFSADIFSILTDRFANPFTGSWSIALTNSGHDLTLVYAGTGAIPEPSTYAAIFGTVALALAALRRRPRAKSNSLQSPL